MNRVVVETSLPAVHDVDRIYLYVAERSPQNAELVQDAFLAVLERLAESPTLGHVHPEINDDSIRFVPFKSFEVAYEYVGGKVNVLRVVHSARNYPDLQWR